MLKWIFERCDGTGKAVLSPIGYLPQADAIDIKGLKISPENMKELFVVHKNEWISEVESLKKYYENIGKKLPIQLKNELLLLEKRLKEYSQ